MRLALLCRDRVVGVRRRARLGAAAPATRQPPRTPIVTRFVKDTEAIVRRMDVCYRHPGRETGVSCSNCGRPICPECMTPTSVGMRCPECGGQRTTGAEGRRAARGDEPMVTYVLLGIIVLVQLGAMASGANATGSQFGGSELISDGAVSRAAVADGEVLAADHGRVPPRRAPAPAVQRVRAVRARDDARARDRASALRDHLLRLAARRARSARCSWSPDALTVGASGAIFGLMGAAVVVMRNRGINPMESGLGLWLGINLVFTFAIPGISIGGHLGGLVGGALARCADVRRGRPGADAAGRSGAARGRRGRRLGRGQPRARRLARAAPRTAPATAATVARRRNLAVTSAAAASPIAAAACRGRRPGGAAPRPARRVLRLDEQARLLVADDLGQPAVRGGHDGHARRGGLERRQAGNGLGARRRDGHRVGGARTRVSMSSRKPDQAQAVAERELRPQPLELALRPLGAGPRDPGDQADHGPVVPARARRARVPARPVPSSR